MHSKVISNWNGFLKWLGLSSTTTLQTWTWAKGWSKVRGVRRKIWEQRNHLGHGHKWAPASVRGLWKLGSRLAGTMYIVLVTMRIGRGRDSNIDAYKWLQSGHKSWILSNSLLHVWCLLYKRCYLLQEVRSISWVTLLWRFQWFFLCGIPQGASESWHDTS